MGCDIIQHESDKPGKRSRLWKPSDIKDVLTKKKGTEKIKGISLNLSEVQGKMNLEVDAFVGMNGLRFLKVYVTHICDLQGKLHIQDKLHCGLQLYTDKLAYLEWRGYPLKSLSLQICAQNLVELDLSDSKVKTLWEGAQEFVSLKILILRSSKYLARTPNLSKARNIVKMALSDCVSLVEVHWSIQYLDKLEHFDLSGCRNLKILPNRLDSEVLEYFDLSRCHKVKKCPEFSPCLLLHGLYLEETSIKELSSSIEFLSRLIKLDMKGCKYLSQLPNCLDNLKSLVTLELQETAITELPYSIENLTRLRDLNLFYCEKLESLPTNLHRLSSLSIIDMNYCKRLCSIPKLPPLLTWLRAACCESLGNFFDNSIKCDLQREMSIRFDFSGCSKLSEKACNNILSFAQSTFLTYAHQVGRFILPGSEIPPWIYNQAEGSSVNVQIPSNFATIRTVLCCAVFKGEDSAAAKDFCVLRYLRQFKGDSRNEGHIKDQFLRSFYLYHIGSSDQTMLCNFGKEALDCVVDDELTFVFVFKELLDPTRESKTKVSKCGISFLA